MSLCVSRPLTYVESLGILLDGTCGRNANLIAKETGLSYKATRAIKDGVHQETLDKLGWFVWRKMNAHLLLCDEDKA